MSEFFKGWRRKAGCGLLVIALVAAIGWTRSCVCNGQVVVFLAIDRQQHWIFFEKEGIDWLRWRLKANECGQSGIDSYMMLPSIVEEAVFGELHLMPFLSMDDGFTKTTVPFWWIEGSLTFISAYLILWPIKRKAAMPTEKSTTLTQS